jgi:hypothetical protein
MIPSQLSGSQVSSPGAVFPRSCPAWVDDWVKHRQNRTEPQGPWRAVPGQIPESRLELEFNSHPLLSKLRSKSMMVNWLDLEPDARSMSLDRRLGGGSGADERV